MTILTVSDAFTKTISRHGPSGKARDSFEMKAQAALTTAYGGHDTDWMPVEGFDSGRLIFDWTAGDATSMETLIDGSDDGTRVMPLPTVAAPSSGVSVSQPLAHQFVAANFVTNQFWLGDEATLGTLVGADMNSTADQEIELTGAPARFVITRIVATNASIELTAADGGVYPTTAKGGTAIVAATQVYTDLVLPADTLELTIVDTSVQHALTSIYLSLTGAQGAAATADFTVYGKEVFVSPIVDVDLTRVRYVRARSKKTGGSATSNLSVRFIGGR